MSVLQDAKRKVGDKITVGLIRDLYMAMTNVSGTVVAIHEGKKDDVFKGRFPYYYEIDCGFDDNLFTVEDNIKDPL